MSRLQVRIADLSIDVEGEADLVREIYQDMREHLWTQVNTARVEIPTVATVSDEKLIDIESAPKETAELPKKRAAKKRKASSSSNGSEGRPEKYEPKTLKELALPGISEFYAQYSPKSHPEKLLIFATFLHNNGHDPCTADQLYTCYTHVKQQRPKVFKQAIIDANSEKYNFLSYKSNNDVKVSQIGEDYLQFTMKKS